MPSPDIEKRRQYWRDYYYRHPERAREIRTRKKNELAAWFREFKSQLQCERCGEADPVCLGFHHVDAEEKTFPLGDLRKRGWCRERVLEEVARCAVLCANCHRKLHAGRFEITD